MLLTSFDLGFQAQEIYRPIVGVRLSQIYSAAIHIKRILLQFSWISIKNLTIIAYYFLNNNNYKN
jgi:hypothetical protein